MQIFLINMGGASRDTLQAYIAKHELVIAETITDKDLYDAVVIAGTCEPGTDSQDPLVIDSDLRDRLSDSTKPVVAIGGGGFELACGLVGMEIAEVFEQDSGASRIIPTDDGAKLFQGTDPLVVKETKRWLVDELPKSLQVLARSESGIEAFRHKQRPLIALQQLPEDFAYPSDAKLVYGNIFGLFGRM
jgi:anthranilate/para-aminobenzoate synthase component II